MLGLKDFEEFNKQYNNVYQSTIMLAKMARSKAKETHYSVLDSQALTWALTGEKPIFVDKNEFDEFRKSATTEDILNYVSDKRIVESVQCSLNESRARHKLTYLYEETLSDEDRQRVSILTNLIWYKASID